MSANSFNKAIVYLKKLLFHSKRALSDDDIIRGLKMYESQMSRMKNKIAAQLAVMDKQRRRIRDIKYYLKRKGDDFDKEDLQGEIVFQTSNILEKLQLASLENLIRETDHHEKGQKVSDRCQSIWCQNPLFLSLSLWMKSSIMTIQIKGIPIEQYFPVHLVQSLIQSGTHGTVILIHKVLSLGSLGKILKLNQ